MIVSCICAVGDNGVIGSNGQLPWKLPIDLKRFRALTEGHAVIMGRKTFDSLGGPLKKRMNIVVSRSRPTQAYENTIFVETPQLAIAVAIASGSQEAWVIGGSSIYESLLPWCYRVVMTFVHNDFEGDVYFPFDTFNKMLFTCQKRETFQADGRNPFDTTIVELIRDVEGVMGDVA